MTLSRAPCHPGHHGDTMMHLFYHLFDLGQLTIRVPLVIGEIDRAPFNAFALVLFLLQLENMLNEELL